MDGGQRPVGETQEFRPVEWWSPAGSGLFPAGPPRPAYREPLPVRPGAALVGASVGAGWLCLLALLGGSFPGRVMWLAVAGTAGWATALLLARYGDRGVAAGLAAAIGTGWALVAAVILVAWWVGGTWPLW